MKLLGAALVALMLGGCASILREPDVPINPKYAVSEDASAECIDAAKRASRWCVLEHAVNSDGAYSRNCVAAQWDYARHRCR